MSKFVYLTNKSRCPVCFVRRSFSADNCHNCGVRLFRGVIDFDAFEEGTGIVNWWAWSGELTGWKFRDHWMIETAAPLESHFTMPEIPKDYGKTITPDEVRSRKAQTKKIKLREKMKIKPMMKKVY